MDKVSIAKIEAPWTLELHTFMDEYEKEIWNGRAQLDGKDLRLKVIYPYEVREDAISKEERGTNCIAPTGGKNSIVIGMPTMYYTGDTVCIVSVKDEVNIIGISRLCIGDTFVKKSGRERSMAKTAITYSRYIDEKDTIIHGDLIVNDRVFLRNCIIDTELTTLPGYMDIIPVVE